MNSTTTFAPRPVVTPPAVWNSPKPQEHSLTNGLPVEVYHLPGQRLVCVALMLPVGSASEPAGQEGLTPFMLELMTVAAGDDDSVAFRKQLAQLGADLSVSTGHTGSAIILRVPGSHLAAALKLLAATVIAPRFEQEDVDRLQKTKVEEIAFRFADPAAIANWAGAQTYYPAGSRLRVLRDGSVESVSGLSRESVIDFFDRFIGLTGAAIAIAGDFGPDDVTELVEQAFGCWKASVVGRSAFPDGHRDPAGPRLVLIDRPGSVQSMLQLMAAAPGAGTATATAFETALHGLAGSTESVLWDLMRTQKGYTYGCHASTVRLPTVSSAIIMSSVDTLATIEACRDLREVLGSAGTGGLTAQVLESAVQEMLNQAPAEFETAWGTVHQAMTLQRLNLPADYFDRTIAERRELTLSVATAAFCDTVDLEQTVLVIVGDLAAIKDQIGDLADLGWGEPVVLELPGSPATSKKGSTSDSVEECSSP